MGYTKINVRIIIVNANVLPKILKQKNEMKNPAVVAESVRALLFNTCSNTYLEVEGSNLGASICVSNFDLFLKCK